MLDTSTSISLEGDILGVKTYNVFKSIKITNVMQRWFIKFFGEDLKHHIVPDVFHIFMKRELSIHVSWKYYMSTKRG